jgi:hypothetical protein
MFDTENETYRYCIYCETDCWLEPEYQLHAEDCPVKTGLWPVNKSDYDMDIYCGMCPVKFELNDFYMHYDLNKNIVSSPSDQNGVLQVICIGCAASISILGIKYE